MYEEKKLLPIKNIKFDEIQATQENPNIMADKDFERLVDAIKEHGLDQPIKVWFNDEIKKYEIVKGNHRFWALKFLKWTEADFIVGEYENRDHMLTDLVKDNVVKGRLDPEKFSKLYETMSSKYGDEIMKEMFSFIDDKELKKMVKQVRDELPAELKKKLDDAKDEIRTIDDLSQILNRLFAEYGSTLECGFMMIDYGGKDSIWIRANKSLWDVIKPLSEKVYDAQVDISDVIYEILTSEKTHKDYANLEKVEKTEETKTEPEVKPEEAKTEDKPAEDVKVDDKSKEDVIENQQEEMLKELGGE